MRTNLFGKRFQQWTLSLLIPAFAFTGGPAGANPQGGVVVHGAADIARVASNQLRIHQQSNAVIINWQDFSIGKGEVARFVQPNNGTALNRVTSGNVSQIHGQLKANANVYVVNPNGIVIGANGVIDVGGNAVLSTLDIDNEDFINGGAGRFYGDSKTGVTNFGTVTSANGDVVLMGGFVDNQGQIGALNGNVAIGSGGDILLQEGVAGSTISVRGASEHEGKGIDNGGTIRAVSAELKAHGNVYALAINNGGAIRANGADRRGGRVLLRASGGSSNINLGSRSSIQATAGTDGGNVAVEAVGGSANLAGRVEANGTRSGGSVSVVGREVEQAAGAVVEAKGETAGGSVAMDASDSLSVSGEVSASAAFGTGGNVDLTGSAIRINDSADIRAEGLAAGGVIRVGGDFQGQNTGLREADSVEVADGAVLNADAGAGNAGRVIAWSNGTMEFYGDVSASARGAFGDGGLVEVSGKRDLRFDGKARVTSNGGQVGSVLFDPGNVNVGGVGSTITVSSINDTLQNGAHVFVVTHSGDITFDSLGGGGALSGGTSASDRNSSIQWTNSESSFAAFASGNIYVNNHIRTSGAGSINLLAGWGGRESDATLSAYDPQGAWDVYLGQGQFGVAGGSVIVGSSSMDRHVEVGSRFGDTNVAGYDVRVSASGTAASNRYAMIGFRDGGQVFAPVLDKGGNFRLDMKVGAASGGGAWLLSDGKNTPNMAAAGAGDPIVGVAGRYEVDVNGDGIMDGVNGINSTGRVVESFIPYANHFNSADSGNWWWQQIEDSGNTGTKDPLNLGGLLPEHGAGRLSDRADINVIARNNVALTAGAGSELNAAMIGHGGPNRSNATGSGTSVREVGNEDPSNATFSNAGIQGNQMERRWSVNGTHSPDFGATSISRLAAVYGNINVLGGVDTSAPIAVNRASGTVIASFGPTGNVTLRANQTFKTATPSSNSPAQIGHGGLGQFGEYYGDIRVETGGSVTLQAGEATRSAAVIGHTFYAHSYWNPTSVAAQQIRFFATAGDFDNTNLRRGELFSGNVTTGYDPTLDPARTVRYTLADYTLSGAAGSFVVTVNPGNTGNFIPEVVAGNLTGRFQNVNQPSEFINMNPLLYSRGQGGATAFGTAATSQGRDSVAPLTLAPTGVEVVEALDGSVATGLHGDIRVVAHRGDVTLTGFSTDGITGNFARDSRFAAIGHGGTNASNVAGLGSGYQNLSQGTISVPGITSTGTVTGNVEGREIVDLRINATGNQIAGSGSRSEIGPVGNAVNRAHMFMTITGDIEVEAGRDLIMTAGNDVQDYTRLGHGGATLADQETSSFILGDIKVRAGRDLSLTGGGAITNITRGGDFDMRAWSQIGHGGYRSGFLGYIGDIDVQAGGNVTLTNGAHSWNYAKIGHQGVEDMGQSGGSFLRNEHYIGDLNQTTIATDLQAGSATITYGSVTGGISRSLNLTASGAGTLVGADRNTSNVSVIAGGAVTLTHMQEGLRQPTGRTGTLGDPDTQTLGVRTRNSYAQIGHGGVNTTYITNAPNNTGFNFAGKTGNITVDANGGNVVLQNGTGESRWTRIGHGVGTDDRVTDNGNIGAARAIELAGNITVTASGSIDVNADFADENERSENTDALFGPAAPSRRNPVAIGHGGVYNNQDVVALSKGELIGGIASSSNITVDAGGNITVRGGKGVEASFAQIGHGFSSDVGDDFARRLGVNTGFAGDISVRAGIDVLVKGSDNAWSAQPSGLANNEAASSHGAFAAIGHGGYQLDAPSSGNISVYVGRDVNLIAQQRTDVATTLTSGIGGAYAIKNLSIGSDAVAGAFNFSKIGHFAVENGDRQATVADAVTGARMDGDIVVVANRDIFVTGGTTPNVDTQTIFGSFAQIGHGGPAIAGDLDGDVTVLAGRDLAVTAGSERTSSSITTRDINNYAMIGNGDYLRDTNANATYVFNSSATGNRFGDINIATGRNATFNGALVGHGDPLVSNLDPTETEGVTRVAVSRLNPFYGGRGFLTAVSETVFASGGVGREHMEFYMPARSTNFMDATTRINETSATFVTAPSDFAAPFNKANGALAGRADEVYLTPDLWWDQTGKAASLGISGGGFFPIDASGNHGGAIATVNSPGGLPELVSLTPGTLGSSATVYRDLNGVSGSGLYTLYYDAIEESVLPPVVPVDPPVAPSVTPPPLVFDFFGLAFTETYDAFFREEELEDSVAGDGSGLFPLLGLFERDENLVEESGAVRVENAVDNLFGDRRDSNSEEEEDEERESRIARGQAGGPLGMSFYVFEPGTNRYSSYRVFGYQVGSFIPVE